MLGSGHGKGLWIEKYLLGSLKCSVSSLYMACVYDSSMAVIRHQDRGHLKGKEVIWSLQFQRVRVHGGRWQVAGAAAESSQTGD